MLKYDAKTGEKTTEDVPESPPIVTAINPEIEEYRREHLNAARMLCNLANCVYTGKLTNERYKELAIAAAADYQNAGYLALALASLNYTCAVLKGIEGESWWDNMGDEQ